MALGHRRHYIVAVVVASAVHEAAHGCRRRVVDGAGSSIISTTLHRCRCHRCVLQGCSCASVVVGVSLVALSHQRHFVVIVVVVALALGRQALGMQLRTHRLIDGTTELNNILTNH